MAVNPAYAESTERIRDLERQLRSAKTITSDFKVRDQKVAELEAKIEAERKARTLIPVKAEPEEDESE